MGNEKEDTHIMNDNETIKKALTSLVPILIMILIKIQIIDSIKLIKVYAKVKSSRW